LLNPALCQSLYGFNPLTINPPREPNFKKAPFFYGYFFIVFVRIGKSGLKIGWFSVKKCNK
jgi:hypothetical protein